jgi:hypothetical protein
MTQLENLKISVDSLMTETKRISQFLSTKQVNLIFFHNILQADIDYKSYCSLYAAIKSYSNAIPPDADTQILKEKIEELPALSQKDFAYSPVSVPTILLFLVLPLGIIVWIINYVHINALSDKMRSIERTLGTVEFMLRAFTR